MIALQPYEQPAINKKAMAWTIAVHCLLFLFFMLCRYTILPDTRADDSGGLEVNLGSSDNGSGDDQPMSTKDPAQFEAAVILKKDEGGGSELPKEINRTTEADAPVIDNAKSKPGPAKIAEPVRKPQKPLYTYGGDKGEQGGNKAKTNAPGTGEGKTNGPGDQGVPGGTPGAANYTGVPGNGTGGIGHTLTGRAITPDKFEAEFRESGKVVIRVTVDRNGNIIGKRVTFSSSTQLKKIALDKLNDTKFNKTDGPEPEQFGDVTIIFKTRQ